MNIFYISPNAIQAAQWMVDKHVVRMILESAQLLSTSHRLLDGELYAGKSKSGRSAKRWRLYDHREDSIYSATHINHPSAVWTRTSVENYLWLVEHFYALNEEYTYRYGKVHKCFGLAYDLQSPPKNLTEYDMTPMPCAMDKSYIISDDPVVNYRNYYKTGKQHLHCWSKRNPPDWIL
jgi:hypothetical protein